MSLLVAGIAIVLACPAGALGAEPLRGQWHLEEDCVNPCAHADSSGNNLTAAEVGNPLTVPGRFGSGLRFSSESDYADAGDHAELQPANITVLAWVRSPTVPPTVKGIVSQGAAGSCSYSSYSLYTGGSAPGDGGTRFYVHTTQNVSSVTPPVDNTKIWDGQWHLLAGTYDGATVRVYLDGQLANAGKPASGPIAYGLPLNNKFIIGGVVDPACSEDTSFSGDIDETRVYSRALSGGELQRLAAAPGPNAPDLVPDDVAPDARVTATTLTPVTGKVIGLDPSASVARLGQIEDFRFDFDNSGRYDATCPPEVPVAYKMFDTPGTKLVNMQAIATNGGIANTQIALKVSGKSVARNSAITGPLTQLSTLKNFWCGDQKSLVKLSTDYLPPLFTSEVRAVGIDITQGVVPDPPRPSGLTRVVTKSRPRGLGSAITLGSILLNNDKQDPQNPVNHIKWLQKGGKTIVRVYASTIVAPNGANVPDVQMKLYGFSQSKDLPGSPLLSETGPLTVPLGPPFTTHAMRIGYDPAKGQLPVFTFTLPDSWTLGNLKLLATPSLVGKRLDRQCSTLECGLARQASDEVLFANTGLFIVRSVAMTDTKDKPLPAPSDVFKEAFNLSPVAAIASPYQATIDISNIISCTATTAYPNPCQDKNGKTTDASGQGLPNLTAMAMMSQWATDNQINVLDKIKYMDIGVHKGHGQLNGYSVWPGKCDDNANGGAICEVSTVVPTAEVTADRPLTSVGHEMFHGLGRPHADDSTGCGGGGEGKPDGRGTIQSIGLDRRAGSGGSLTQPYKVISPNLPGGKTSFYDVMSYCASTADDDSWLSAYNWDTLGNEWTRFQAKSSSLRSMFEPRAVNGPAVEISGYTAGSQTQIVQVQPTANGGPVGPANSPYRLLARNAAGQVTGSQPLEVTYGHLDALPGKGQLPEQVATFHGTVPASAAQQVEVTNAGLPAATASRSGHAPKLRLLSPRSGSVGRGRTVKVRWRASDADGGRRLAFVDFSTDGGRHFRNVFTGADKGSASLSTRYLTAASNARLRVRVNDGFNETSVSSGRLRTAGAAPEVSILNPRPNQRAVSDSSLYLRGTAFDDATTRLTGRRLRWFIGRRQVGVGEAVTVTDLPPGRPVVELRARDRRGRVGRSRVRLRVTAAAPFFVTLTPPKRKLSSRARSVRLRVAANVTSMLRAGGRRFVISRHARTIVVPITRGSKTLKLALALSSHGKRAASTLQIAR